MPSCVSLVWLDCSSGGLLLPHTCVQHSAKRLNRWSTSRTTESHLPASKKIICRRCQVDLCRGSNSFCQGLWALHTQAHNLVRVPCQREQERDPAEEGHCSGHYQVSQVLACWLAGQQFQGSIRFMFSTSAPATAGLAANVAAQIKDNGSIWRQWWRLGLHKKSNITAKLNRFGRQFENHRNYLTLVSYQIESTVNRLNQTDHMY